MPGRTARLIGAPGRQLASLLQSRCSQLAAFSPIASVCLDANMSHLVLWLRYSDGCYDNFKLAQERIGKHVALGDLLPDPSGSCKPAIAWLDPQEPTETQVR